MNIIVDVVEFIQHTLDKTAHCIVSLASLGIDA